MRLGIYGGSFDPIHRGHVAAALAVRRARGLDRVLLVPAGAPPHKGQGCVAPVEHRLAMARLAVRGHGALEVLDLEARRAPPSYTVDTVEELRRRWPDASFDLLVGTDMLLDMPRWRRARDLVGQVTVVAFPRPGVDRRAAERAFREAFGGGRAGGVEGAGAAGDPRGRGDRFIWLEIPVVEASSTEVRRRLAAGVDLGDLLDPAVAAYIRREGLYREGG